MHPKRAEQLSKQLADVATGALPAGRPWGVVRTRLLESGLVLIDGVADAFDEICTEILTKDGLGKRFSEPYLRKWLNQLIAAFRGNQNLDEVQQGLLALCAEHAQWTTGHIVHVPVQGLRLQSASLALGNIVLVQATPEHNNAVTDAIDRVVAQASNYPPGFSNLQKALVQQGFAQGVCSESTFAVEPERARELALVETERGLAILRYCLASVLPSDYRAQFGIGRAVITERPILPTLAEDGQSFGLSVPVAEPLELSEDYLEWIKRAGADVLSEMARKPSPTEFEQALLRAVDWLSDACVQRRRENQLLSLTACLEALFSPKDGDPISNAIAEAAAILLADSVAVRKDLKRRVKRLYGLRSAISHGGGRRVLTADVEELQSMATKLIRSLLGRIADFQTQSALLDWIEDEKLSPRIAPMSSCNSGPTASTNDK